MATVTTDAVSASSLAEVSWVESGLPHVRGVVALVHADRPVLAFTYADADVARAVAAAPEVVLSLTETRSTGTSFRPLLVAGRPRLVEDPTGDVFAGDLLVQELRRYPPSRVYADSPILQREHWWYLPRMLVEVDVDAAQPVTPRRDPVTDHLLVVAKEGVPDVRLARLLDLTEDRARLDVEGPAPASGPAVLFGQDATFPDLEQWTQWHYRGRWDGSVLEVDEAPARTGVGRPAGVVQRWRRQRELERRCVAAIPRP